jgi:hypothetical protein
MSLRFPKILRSIEYRDPAEFVRLGKGGATVQTHTPAPACEPVIDRYHRQARRLTAKNSTTGKTR